MERRHTKRIRPLIQADRWQKRRGNGLVYSRRNSGWELRCLHLFSEIFRECQTADIQDTYRKRNPWACWVGGGDNEDAFFVLNYSDDDGGTWSDPKLVIDPQNPALSEKRRTIVGNLWTDPSGRLWLFFDQAMTYFDGRAGFWYSRCDNPNDNKPEWSEPVRIWHGCALNKPIVLKDSTWVLDVSLWDRSKIKSDVFKNAFPELDSLRMANILVSTDEG